MPSLRKFLATAGPRAFRPARLSERRFRASLATPPPAVSTITDPEGTPVEFPCGDVAGRAREPDAGPSIPAVTPPSPGEPSATGEPGRHRDRPKDRDHSRGAGRRHGRARHRPGHLRQRADPGRRAADAPRSHAPATSTGTRIGTQSSSIRRGFVTDRLGTRAWKGRHRGTRRAGSAAPGSPRLLGRARPRTGVRREKIAPDPVRMRGNARITVRGLRARCKQLDRPDDGERRRDDRGTGTMRANGESRRPAVVRDRLHERPARRLGSPTVESDSFPRLVT